MLNIGCHLSASKGFKNMGEESLKIKANTFQFFTRNPRGGKIKELNIEDINNLLEIMKKNQFAKILAHAPYTMNLCSDKEDIREFAKNMMKEDLERMEYIPGNMYNFHPGSHVNAGEQAGIAQIVKGLNTVLNQNDDDVFIALETMAGKGSEIGRSFEELKAIYDGVDRKERLRVCFDTCHVNDAGYDIVNHYDDVFAEFDRVIGLEQIAVFHVNDSLNPLGAHKDRHANIGKGTIGYDTLHRLVHDETFANVPKILETPWLCEEGSAKKTIPPYKEEIEWLLK